MPQQQQVTLRDGAVVTIRPIEPDDRERLAAGFERLSPESRYRRFFSPVSRLTERQLDYLTRVDHRDHEALVAIDATNTGDIVGVARYVRTQPGEAEPAMVVADDWHGRGIATILLARLVDRALDEGITSFNAPVLAGNNDAINVLRRLGDTTVTRRGTEVELRIALQAPTEPSGPLRTLLRVVAAGTVDPALTFWQRMLPRGGLARRPGVDEDRANVIVVAVDEHGGGEAAIALAQAVAAGASADVVVVAARHPLLDDRPEVEQRAERVAARLRAHGVQAEAVVRAGDLGVLALDLAYEHRARLIVVADSPDPDTAGRLLGEPWDHISHHAPCSVLVAR